MPWADRRGLICWAHHQCRLIIENIEQGVEFRSATYPSRLPLIGSTERADGGFFLFPLACGVGGLLSGVCGFKRARRRLLASFNLAALLPMLLADRAPAAASFYQPGGIRAGFLVMQQTTRALCSDLPLRSDPEHTWVVMKKTSPRLCVSPALRMIVSTLVW